MGGFILLYQNIGGAFISQLLLPILINLSENLCPFQ